MLPFIGSGCTLGRPVMVVAANKAPSGLQLDRMSTTTKPLVLPSRTISPTTSTCDVIVLAAISQASALRHITTNNHLQGCHEPGHQEVHGGQPVLAPSSFWPPKRPIPVLLGDRNHVPMKPLLPSSIPWILPDCPIRPLEPNRRHHGLQAQRDQVFLSDNAAIWLVAQLTGLVWLYIIRHYLTIWCVWEECKLF